MAFETAVHRGTGERWYGGPEGSENVIDRQTLRAWSYVGLFLAVSVGGRSASRSFSWPNAGLIRYRPRSRVAWSASERAQTRLRQVGGG